MIRMIQCKSSKHAKSYFQDALSKSDYFISDQELPGFWQGRLAERLGLTGETSKEAFFALCENRQPATNEALTPRNADDRTIGYDINFHCPKSVSILNAFAGDDHIIKVFQESVTETMRSIESDCKTRVRLDGRQEDRDTQEMVWGHFTHQTARPVKDAMPDPHLHSHCFVFNATWDDQEVRIKAGQFREIKKDMPYYQAQFHKILADKLIDSGYDIRRTDKSFEIEGVPQRVIDLFSKRTDEIGRVAKEKGITSAKDLGELGARTRAQKQKGRTMDELTKEWKTQIESIGEEAHKNNVVRFAPQKEEQKTLSARQCVDYAVSHSFERASVMDDRRILASAFRHGIGHSTFTVDDIKGSFAEDHRLIHVKEGGRRVATTKSVLAEEKRMVELARAGQGKNTPIYKEAPEMSLVGQQAAAIAHVLTTEHRVSIVRGAAGTGKTTLMQEAARLMEAAGKTVTVVAPSTQASRGVLRNEGFDKADTVAQLLNNTEMQENLKNQVLWVDEAGMLGTKNMTALLELTEKQNAQLILGGDTRQHSSVDRGDALRILNKVAGIRTAEVSKIYRQDEETYRDAIQDLSQGKVRAGFDKLNNLGFIKEIDPLKAEKKIVEEYVQALKQGKSTLLITPTHAQGEAITAEIRARLKDEGLIGKKGFSVPQLHNRNLTEAEKSDARNFNVGDIVKFTQNMPSFRRGSHWEVVMSDKDAVMIHNKEGEIKPLPLAKSKQFAIYSEQKFDLSKGDKVMITANGYNTEGKRLNNGAMLTVEAIGKSGSIKLRNEKSKTLYEIDRSYGHLAHAHSITSHASQSKTVDEVFIYQPASTLPATDAKQFYVSVSRARHQAHIYTDNKDELLEHASQLGDRRSALELTNTMYINPEFNHRSQVREYIPPQPQKNYNDYERD